ncbi:MAG: hypothetical protein HC799_03220 [Limnothrix sp. RL_2_0]|nr:hypothetical protein [Limnothrix sp. RL_2_0]
MKTQSDFCLFDCVMIRGAIAQKKQQSKPNQDSIYHADSHRKFLHRVAGIFTESGRGRSP